MESISTNYKKVSEIQEELKNVNIENYLEFNYRPMLGHLPTKCPKLDYEKKAVK